MFYWNDGWCDTFVNQSLTMCYWIPSGQQSTETKLPDSISCQSAGSDTVSRLINDTDRCCPPMGERKWSHLQLYPAVTVNLSLTSLLFLQMLSQTEEIGDAPFRNDVIKSFAQCENSPPQNSSHKCSWQQHGYRRPLQMAPIQSSDRWCRFVLVIHQLAHQCEYEINMAWHCSYRGPASRGSGIEPPPLWSGWRVNNQFQNAPTIPRKILCRCVPRIYKTKSNNRGTFFIAKIKMFTASVLCCGN